MTFVKAFSVDSHINSLEFIVSGFPEFINIYLLCVVLTFRATSFICHGIELQQNAELSQYDYSKIR